MKFYCQLDYGHIPYVSPISPEGNLADNGCGVCTSSMLIENLLGIDFPPEVSAPFAKANGAREGFGTDLSILAPALAQEFNLNCIKTRNIEIVKAFLEHKKGLAIANTTGDRDDWIGVFSDGRHYIVLAGIENNICEVWDPLYKDGNGRYDKEGRKGKVTIKDECRAFADFSIIENDCIGRNYYLFYLKRN